MMWKLALVTLLFSSSGHAAMQTVTSKDKDADSQILSATPPPPGTPSASYMMISPSSRAADFQQAFEQLRKEKSAGKVYFQLADGTTIANVIDMNLMTNSTLVIFRFNSSQGIRFQVVKVEDIINIYY